MSDWFSATTQAQRELFRIHEAQVDAVRRMMQSGGAAADFQDAGRRAMEAQAKAWTSWARLWGWAK